MRLRMLYCGHKNAVSPGMWSGGIVGLKSILDDHRRIHLQGAVHPL